MKIGIIDVDSHRWPNLCLMKLSAYHKAQGDDVEWWTPEGRYDLVYKSRVFTDTYSKDKITVTNADKLICGGTGYGPGPNLPDAVEHSAPTTASIRSFLIPPMAFSQGDARTDAASVWCPARKDTEASTPPISQSSGTDSGKSN